MISADPNPHLPPSYQKDIAVEDTRSPSLVSQQPIILIDQTNLLPFRKLITIFSWLALCTVVSTLDSVIVATSLSTISRYFEAGSVISWIPSAYLLTSTCFQPLYGRLSDIFGRKCAITFAMILFMAGNLASGFATNIEWLIICRGVAGAGGGGISNMVHIIVSDIVSLRERGKYYGIIGTMVGIGYAIGPLIGGALASRVSWRWCFWITLPPTLIAMVGVIAILPLKPVTGNLKRKLFAVDYIGVMLSLGSNTLIILPLIWGGVVFPWVSGPVLGTLLGGAVLLVGFCLWEWYGAKLPIVPMYIFSNTVVSGVYITMFVNGFVFFSSLYYLPQYFEVALGYTTLATGKFLVPLLVSQVVANFVSGYIVSRTGRYRALVLSGFAMWSIACGCISTVTPKNGSRNEVVMITFMIIAGLGAGQTLQTTTVAAQASVSRKDMSVVTAFRNFIRMLGGALSTAVGSTIVNNFLRQSMSAISTELSPIPEQDIVAVLDYPAGLSQPGFHGMTSAMQDEVMWQGYIRGFRGVFILNACLTVLAFAISLGMVKHVELVRAEDKIRRDVSKRDSKIEQERIV